MNTAIGYLLPILLALPMSLLLGFTPAPHKVANASIPIEISTDRAIEEPAFDAEQSGVARFDKFSLWTGGPHLRGVNIWQRLVFPELDGPEFMGSGYVGPPFNQADFDRLAELGANYVNLSGPGLFSEQVPFAADERVAEHLDRLLDMIGRADMFAVISFRTGPGRSEFTFVRDEAGDWFDENRLNDSVWRDQAAQDAWVEMWRYTAQRYRSHPIVVGFDLMVEPNAEEVWFDIYGEPEDFYPEHADTLFDWNQLHPRISSAIREVDPDTPILIGAAGYSGTVWLPYLEPTGDPKTVYTVHPYEPVEYVFQFPPSDIRYPGHLDLDDDGRPEVFNRKILEQLLHPIDTFIARHNLPVAANEFGPMRWQPGAAAYVADQIELFEKRQMNHALWAYNPSWPPFQENDAFDFLHGPDPNHHEDVESSSLLEVIKSYWARNTVRPSTPDTGLSSR
ncbi:MAG: cellulase family glycosylhydrolase [Trueperaceae bacterium]|nr:MAG: cellulase family glycosylhydrolase [Trueperaceae bacterium]